MENRRCVKFFSGSSLGCDGFLKIYNAAAAKISNTTAETTAGMMIGLNVLALTAEEINCGSNTKVALGKEELLGGFKKLF